MMARIVETRALSNYRLFVRFDDGSKGEVDLSDRVGRGVFSAWSNPGFFARVAVDAESGTVCWPGGIDLCPDVLYHNITGTPLPGEYIQSV